MRSDVICPFQLGDEIEVKCQHLPVVVEPNFLEMRLDLRNVVGHTLLDVCHILVIFDQILLNGLGNNSRIFQKYVTHTHAV